jgi:hypothetical protein
MQCQHGPDVRPVGMGGTEAAAASELASLLEATPGLLQVNVTPLDELEFVHFMRELR